MSIDDAIFTPATLPVSSRCSENRLGEALAELAAMVTGGRALPDLLGQVARCATHAIPGADGAGIALFRLDRPVHSVQVLAADRPFISRIDEIQYSSVHEGPGMTATLTCGPVRSGSLGGDRRWPRFGPRAGRLGMHSALSLPLVITGEMVGTLTVYAGTKDAFDDRARQLGEIFAVPAAVAVCNARALARALAINEQLRTALESRPIIDQAVGLIRGRTGATVQQSEERLRESSRREHATLINVAQRLVDEAVRRAQARNSSR